MVTDGRFADTFEVNVERTSSMLAALGIIAIRILATWIFGGTI